MYAVFIFQFQKFYYYWENFERSLIQRRQLGLAPHQEPQQPAHPVLGLGRLALLVQYYLQQGQFWIVKNLEMTLVTFKNFFASQDCHAILDSNSGSFSSPYYPSNYPNNANCSWIITATSQIELRFNMFRTQASRDLVKVSVRLTQSRVLHNFIYDPSCQLTFNTSLYIGI